MRDFIRKFYRMSAAQKQTVIEGICAEYRAGNSFSKDEFAQLPGEIRQAILNDMRADILERLTAMRQPTTTPEPRPQAEPAATYNLPTNRMRQQLARFDDLNDADQVDQLKAMGW